MDVKVISHQYIKPASPTPHHLRTQKLSVLDQASAPFYTFQMSFYVNNNQGDNLVVSERLTCLRKSLSETLIRFYPLAGMISEDAHHIHCNDQGVYYMETRVNCRLSDLFSRPDNEFIHKLMPKEINNKKKSELRCVVVVQVNVFECGGVAICLSTWHQFVDGETQNVFLKAWAERARTRPSSEQLSLNLVFRDDFKALDNNKYVTRTFAFSAGSIAVLKTTFWQELLITSVEAVSTLVWKCAAKATLQATSGSAQNKPILGVTVSLGAKIVARELSGRNPIWSTSTMSMPLGHDTRLGLYSMLRLMRKNIPKMDTYVVENEKIDEGCLQISVIQGDLNCSHNFMECGAGSYENSDYGWGKAAWILTDKPFSERMIVMMDGRSSGGVIEATVTLTEQEMTIFEADALILKFASVDPSPLELVNLLSYARL